MRKNIITILLFISLTANLFTIKHGIKTVIDARGSNRIIIMDCIGRGISLYEGELENFMINPTIEQAKLLIWMEMDINTNLRMLKDKWYINKNERRLIHSLTLFHYDIRNFNDGWLRAIENKDSKGYNKLVHFNEYINSVLNSMRSNFVSTKDEKYIKDMDAVIETIEEGHESFRNILYTPMETGKY